MCTKAISVSDNKTPEKRKRCSKNLERGKKKMKMKKKRTSRLLQIGNKIKHSQVGFFKEVTR